VALLLCGSQLAAEDEASWKQAEAKVLARLAKQGLGIERAELAPPPKRNGAEALGRALEVLETIPQETRYTWNAVTQIYGGDLSETYHGAELGREEQIELVEQGLRAAKRALPEVETALNAEAILYPVDWARGLPGSLGSPPAWQAGVKEIAWLLLARATVARAAGQHAQAWADLERAFTLPQRLRQPGIVARYTRTALVKIALEGLNHALGAGPAPPPDVRDRLLAALKELQRPPDLPRLVRTELALLLGGLDHRKPLEGIEYTVGFSLAEAPVGSMAEPEQREWVARERALCVQRFAAVLDVLTESESKQPLRERLLALPLIDPTRPPHWGLLASTQDPARTARLTLDSEQKLVAELRKAAEALGR